MEPLTQRGADAVYSTDRLLRGFEAVGRVLVGGCVALFFGESAWDAHGGSSSLGKALVDWPGHILAALTLGVVASGVPFIVRSHLVRAGAVVVLYVGAAWSGVLLTFLAVYSVAMSRFD